MNNEYSQINMNTENKKDNKFKYIVGIFIFIIAVLLILLIVYIANNFIKNYNKITLTNKELVNTSEYIYKLEDSIGDIKGKITTLSPISNTEIKIYAGNLKLYENTFEKKKSWKIENKSLIVGMNTVEITVNFKNGEKNLRHFLYIIQMKII